jgi:hypothetical protein
LAEPLAWVEQAAQKGLPEALQPVELLAPDRMAALLAPLASLAAR